MPTINSGPEIGVVYTLVGPDGTRAVFNDPNDPDYVGVINELTGLDSPEVRESADNLVGADGGIHGDFFYGRRPVVLDGMLVTLSSSQRNAVLTKLAQATNAMRKDAVLSWTPSGGVRQEIRVRRQQPLRISGAWNKTFQVALVAADPYIYSNTLFTSTITPGAAAAMGFSSPLRSPLTSASPVAGNATVENSGTVTSYPTLYLTGPMTNPAIQNYTTGEWLYLTYSLGATEQLVIDMRARSVLLGSESRYSAVDFARTVWWGLRPGNNEIRLAPSAYSTGASLRIDWRHAWI